MGISSTHDRQEDQLVLWDCEIGEDEEQSAEGGDEEEDCHLSFCPLCGDRIGVRLAMDVCRKPGILNRLDRHSLPPSEPSR